MEVDVTSIMAGQADEDNIADSWEDPEPEPIRQPEPAPEPEPEPEPDTSEKYGQDRRRMILIIQMYLNEIPHKLASYKNILIWKSYPKGVGETRRNRVRSWCRTKHKIRCHGNNSRY